MPDYTIREMNPSEYPLLENFLYEAIFQRDETNLLPKTVINDPSLKIYIADFGKKPHDYCVCADVAGEIIGAAWVRIINGFGHLDGDTPEFAISLYKEYRSRGIGTALMKEMLALLARKGYRRTSLAVQKDNYALRMYERLGFQRVDENAEEYIMECRFECGGETR